jgi:hypothetical protein
MDAKFASTNSAISCCVNKTRRQPLGWFDKTILQIVPKNGLLICTSSLQVFVSLQVEFTSSFRVMYKFMYKCI